MALCSCLSLVSADGSPVQRRRGEQGAVCKSLFHAAPNQVTSDQIISWSDNIHIISYHHITPPHMSIFLCIVSLFYYCFIYECFHRCSYISNKIINVITFGPQWGPMGPMGPIGRMGAFFFQFFGAPGVPRDPQGLQGLPSLFFEPTGSKNLVRGGNSNEFSVKTTKNHQNLYKNN